MHSRLCVALLAYAAMQREQYLLKFCFWCCTFQWFDLRYRGYGRNKMVHVAATHAAGFSFYVHPSGFLACSADS